jgi:tRNA uridine 5-carboxymethylaminomethyl modification enzyme
VMVKNPLSSLFTMLLSLYGAARALRPVSLLARPNSARPQRISASALRIYTTDQHVDYDVVVIGGGHAGCDAAAAAARTGARTALVTQRLDTVGELSCNPSIGGIGKGHLVREIDALDGLIGKVADEAGIHYRLLNRRKGPAVRGPRAQMDRDLYRAAMQSSLKGIPNLYLVEASAQDLLLDESSTSTMESMAPMADSHLVDSPTNRKARIRGVIVTKPDGTTQEIMARAVVITTGTFLRGVLMLGHDRYSGGRHLRDSEHVEPPSVGLAQTLERYNFALGRLKTGTPARIDGNTINWDTLVAQPTDDPAMPFSHLLQFHGKQPPMIANNKVVTCYQTATNEETHKLVMKYEDTLPIYDGLDGAGNGPRYCPSIYKKVLRFPDRTGHNCFLEPEGLNTNVVYPNGMSGPYPEHIQQLILRSMKGLENVEIVRPGYDVEYDYVNPTTLTHTLETKQIGGLYLAGQICGTTGYEEAAAQGIVAGANAGRAAAAASAGQGKPAPFVVGRDEGYIGVLIDDLVTRGTSEPYRMFTSRAEYRISLRADNADLRLTRKGVEYGLVQDEQRMAALETREYLIDDRIDKLKTFDLKVVDWAGHDPKMGGAQLDKKNGQKKTAEDVLQMPQVTLHDVENVMMAVQKENGQEVMEPTPASVLDTVEAAVKYQSYVRRQAKDMDSWRKAQGMRIPPDLIYEHKNFPTFSKEELEKLSRLRPSTFAEASNISGVTPQSLVYLYHFVAGRNRRRDGRSDSNKLNVGANSFSRD